MNEDPSIAPTPPGAGAADSRAMGRRDFLRLATAFGLAWHVDTPGVGRLWAGPLAARQCAGPDHPERTGLLSEPEAAAMWSMFAFIGREWDTARFCRITSPTGLRPVLDAKTTIAPSYLTEYRRAAAALGALVRQYGPEAGMRRFFFSNPDACTGQMVVSELVMLQVAQGGFRRFGYVNYAGFMGGPYDDPLRLPYRSWRDAVPAGEG